MDLYMKYWTAPDPERSNCLRRANGEAGEEKEEQPEEGQECWG